MKAFLLLLTSVSLLAQNTNVTVTFAIPNAVLADVLTWTRGQITSPISPATLTSALTIGSATFTLSSGTGYTATDTFSNAGATLLIDSEEITCATFVSPTYSGCTRGVQATTAATHLLGATVQQLKYATNASLLKALLTPGVIAAIQSLSPSTYIATLQTNLTTAQAALNTALATGTAVQ